MAEENEKGIGCFGAILVALLLSIGIAGGINYLFGEGAVEFWDVFIWTFGVLVVIGVIGQIFAMSNNNKLRKASRIEAERIIAEEKENTQDK